MTSLAGIDILIVEDDIDSRELMQFYFESEGASVVLAGSAEEGRSALAARVPHIIFSDMTLPDEDGIGFISAVRSDARSKDVPAVALTGHSDAALRARALDAGFQKFVTKPVDIHLLPAMVLELVAARERPAEG